MEAKHKDQELSKRLRTINRRDFIVTTVAAGVVALLPRWVSAGAAEPYRIGVCLPTTGAGGQLLRPAHQGPAFDRGRDQQKGRALGQAPHRALFPRHPDQARRGRPRGPLPDPQRKGQMHHRHLEQRGGHGHPGDRARAQGAPFGRHQQQLQDRQREPHPLHPSSSGPTAACSPGPPWWPWPK